MRISDWSSDVCSSDLIIGGYVLQRLIEGAFLQWYGMHIHVWEKLDSDFRLITARRNPNMVILFASMLVARPDLGLVAVAAWTALSPVFHAVRLAHAPCRHRRANQTRPRPDQAARTPPTRSPQRR